MATTSLLDGPRALWFGVRFLSGRSDLWRSAAVPALVAALLGSALGVSGAAFAGRAVLHSGASGLGPLLWLLAIAAGAVAFALGVLLGFSLAVPLSGVALERIARAVCVELALPPPEAGAASGVSATLSSLGAALVGILVGAPLVLGLTLLGLAAPPLALVTVPLKVAVLALLVTWDLGDHVFTLYGLRLGERRAWLRAHLGAALSFGWLAGLLLCVPVLGLLCLPVGVAGAARLIAQTRMP